MREIRGRNYSYTMVGATRIDRAIVPVRPFWEIVDEWVAGPADTAMGLTSGLLYRKTRFPGYPLVITEDTAFIDCNFAQDATHTDGLFSIKSGVRVVFGEPDEDKAAGHDKDGRLLRGDCLIVNVKIPDACEVFGGNSVHRILTPTGNPLRPMVGLLCECMKCASYRGELLREMPRDKAGRVKHDIVWERTLERRKDSAKVSSDRAVASASNAAAIAKHGGLVSATAVKRGL